ncbi:MAG: YbfB/YjiJ family MFS transporter [Pseudomonadota bacterium]|nr:YbfB/YjiJ family MFS transporter [Pseudomonadota bacterium]
MPRTESTPDPARLALAPLHPAFGGLLALAVAIGVGRFVYTPIRPPMVASLGLSKFAAGLIASANFAGYLGGALFAAGAWLPGSRRAWLLSALVVSAASTAAMGLTRALPLFLALRFAGGVASVLILASTVVLERLAEAGRPDLSALLFAGVGAGIAASAVLVSAMRAERQAWPSLWLASGVLPLAVIPAIAALIPAGSAPPLHPPRRRADGPEDWRLFRLLAAYGLFGFGYIITATFLVAMVRDDPMSRSLEPVVWVVFGLAAAPSVALWTRLARRLGVPGTFALASVVEALGVLTSVAGLGVAGIFLTAVLVGGTFMGLTALGLVRARELATGDPRRALALMTGAFGLGQILGPAFAGAVYDHLGSFALPSVIAATAMTAAAALARR